MVSFLLFVDGIIEVQRIVQKIVKERARNKIMKKRGSKANFGAGIQLFLGVSAWFLTWKRRGD